MSVNRGARRLYTPAELAARFRIDSKTVARWAKTGKIPAEKIVTTLGGHRRFDADWIDEQLAGAPRPQQDTGKCPQCTERYTSSAHKAQCGSAS
jgi:excisionase family DNA binding protein